MFPNRLFTSVIHACLDKNGVNEPEERAELKNVIRASSARWRVRRSQDPWKVHVIQFIGRQASKNGCNVNCN